MTRADRRAQRHLRPVAVQHSGACPDCDADAALSEHTPGVWVLEVRHDVTCPRYARMTSRGQ